MKNQLISYWLRHHHSSARKEPPERILIVSTTALGDTLWATPAVASLRASFPKSYISVLCSPIGLEVLQNNPQIDRLILLKHPVFRFFSMAKEIQKERFDTALIFHASQRLALPLCVYADIPRLVGSRGIIKGLDDLLTDPIEPIVEHEIERRLRIVESIGGKRTTDQLSYSLTPNEQADASAFLGKKERPWVAMHVGAKEPFRRWPTSCFVQVGRSLQNQLGCQIFLTGVASELPLLRAVQKELPAARLIISSIRFLGACLNEMDLVLSNDTGPFHLACALKRPAIGLFCATDPQFCGPHHAPNAVAIARPPTCSPCLKRRCLDPFCLLQISPEEMIQISTSILKKGQKS